MRLFSEKVQPTFTNSNLNILHVINFTEVYFDVFELEINGEKYIAEKVTEFEGLPVVSIPVTVDGRESHQPFILKQNDTFEVFTNKAISKGIMNESEDLFIEQEQNYDRLTVNLQDVLEDNEEDEVEQIVFEKKDIIIEEIVKARKLAEKHISELSKRKVLETTAIIKSQRDALKKEVEGLRLKLMEEFLVITQKAKQEFGETTDQTVEKLNEETTKSINDATERLFAQNKESVEKSNCHFETTIQELTKKIYTDVISEKIAKDRSSIEKDVAAKFKQVNEAVTKVVADKGIEILNDIKKVFETYDASILNLERTNVELRDNFIKGDNKILSRVGNVKAQLENTVSRTESDLLEKLERAEDRIYAVYDDKLKLVTDQVSTQLEDTLSKTESVITEKINHAEDRLSDVYEDKLKLSESALIEKLKHAEDRIYAVYDDKLKLVSEQVSEISDDVRDSLVQYINESRDSLLERINSIPQTLVVENKKGTQKVDIKAIEKSIQTRFSSELMTIKRMIEMSSGGGSVAQQFANGGTMNGNLTIVGSISASEYLGISTSSGGLSGRPISTILVGDGATSVYAISGANDLTNAAALIVSIDGAVQEPELDYTVNNNVITFTSPILSAARATVIAPNIITVADLNATLDDVTTRGNTTTNSITVSGVYTPYTQFDIAATPLTNAEGLLQWNATDGTLDLGMDGGNIAMQIGQELFQKVRNVSGSTILNGTPVYTSGRTGNRPNIYPAQADTEATSNVIGITTQDIVSPDDGFVTTMGYVRGIKTDYTGSGVWGNTWVTGDHLYVSKSVAGQLTNIEPDAPHHSDRVATVEIVHSNLGSILVGIDRHKTLAELSDINGTPLSASGQFAVWDNTNGYFDFTSKVGYLKYTEKTANYSPLSTDEMVNCTANTFTITLPTAVDIQGKTLYIKNSGTGVITLSGNGSQTIDGVNSVDLTQYDSLTILSTNANWIII